MTSGAVATAFGLTKATVASHRMDMMSVPVPIPQRGPGSSPHFTDIATTQDVAPIITNGEIEGNNSYNSEKQYSANILVKKEDDETENDEPRITVGSSQGDATSSEDVASDYSTEPVKLFVGQVPKSMQEQELFPIFEKYGAMEDVVIIRDKHTGQHRGCAFVTFLSKESAEKCVDELHGQLTLPGGRRPVQIRPAGRKEEVENKVFVGMLPRDVKEEKIRELFEPFGEISGIYIIRNNDGVKKGCAFVKYVERDSALNAIESMNNQVSLEGVDRPLIVKFADTRSQKRARQNQQARRDVVYPGPPSPASHASQATSNGNLYYMPPGPPPMHHVYPGSAPMGMSSQHNSTTVQPYSSQGHYHSAYHAPAPAAHPPNFMYQEVNLYGIATETSHYISQPPHEISRERYPRGLRPLPHRYGMQREMASPRPREGPAGANLFIYHLPHDLTDADLATAFNPFGNVISAKVYVDMLTGESKGFGFVSYDSVISAELAIDQMNGFQIGSKRLKVQHKRVNHRPPAVVPTVHSLYPPGPMDSLPMQDIPPSIEISSVNDDTETAGHTNSSQSTPRNDVEVLNKHFGNLQTEERNEEYEEE